MSDSSYILGIDLGTTYSACSVMQDGEPVMIPNAIGEYLTPSVVSVDDNGDILVGAPAQARLTTHPSQTAAHFKRDMGTGTTIVLGNHKMSPEELSALVLGELKRDAESALGMVFKEAVVTVPAYFGERQRQSTRDAAAIAGLSAERIINEPTAAAMAYGLHDMGREVVAVVLDLGGGTFDVTVIELLEGVIEVQSTAGDTRLGGEDFADSLAEHVASRLAKEQEIFVKGLKSLARLRAAAEDAKRTLSVESRARIALPDLKCSDGVRDVELEITRDEAETVWAPLLERITLPIRRALRDAKLGRDRIEEVLLVGGATRMPCLRALAAKVFARLPSQHLEPDTAVAKGAAIQAALKAGDKSVEDMVVTDVAPFTMGIATVSAIGTRNVEGMFTPIIERGTVIPVSRSDVFSTTSNNQTAITIEVYQGEHSVCARNQKLGEYTVKGLPKKPAGESNVEVRFTYDLNGLLEVDMAIVGTKKRRTLVIQQRPGQLTPKELADARERMKKLKFHPRETLPNRTALSRGDALFAEHAGETRKVLGHALAQMRAALETQDTPLITDAREYLMTTINAVGRKPS